MAGGFFRKCKPAVARYWLLLLAGFLWTSVGIGLCIAACSWLSDLEWPLNGLGILIGFGAGLVIYRFGFSRLAAKNITRIAAQPAEVCAFAFQAWRSYFLILVMMALGFFLRHSHLHRLALAVIYAAIGSALTLSSSLYYKKVFGSENA